MDDGFVDDTLTGNEIIEEAIRLFYQENSDRGFMGICMAIRKRMQEDGHLIFPARVIEEEDTQLYDFHTLKLEGGAQALVAFTNQEELRKGPPTGAVSNFIEPMLENLLQIGGIEGLLINPWGASVFLGEEDIAMILTPGSERFV